MTAGLAATHWPKGIATTPLPLYDAALPYRPRPLARRERSRRDLYTFFSPRNGRIASIMESLNFALALTLEFDPHITAYVERPHRLTLTACRHIDLSFWTRRRDGEESFHLTIPAEASIPTRHGEVAAREQDLLLEAAQRQGLRVAFVFETALIQQGEQLSNYFRLLPYVQSARRIAGRSAILESIRSHLDALPRTTFRQLQLALKVHDPSHVTAVAATMVHAGTLQMEDGFLSLDTALTLGVPYAARK